MRTRQVISLGSLSTASRPRQASNRNLLAKTKSKVYLFFEDICYRLLNGFTRHTNMREKILEGFTTLSKSIFYLKNLGLTCGPATHTGVALKCDST